MSTAALEAKKQQVSDYFTYHPDSQDITIVDDEDSVVFPGMFDYAYRTSFKDKGNVGQQVKDPHVTFYSGYADQLTPMTTELTIDGNTYLVVQLSYDETDGTFQAAAWLQG